MPIRTVILDPPSGQVEDPDPQPGTNNWYTEDGYGGSGAYANNGGSYVNCADGTQPGIGVIKVYFNELPYQVFKKGDCQKHAYYLVNNYNPGTWAMARRPRSGPVNSRSRPAHSKSRLAVEQEQHFMEVLRRRLG